VFLKSLVSFCSCVWVGLGCGEAVVGRWRIGESAFLGGPSAFLSSPSPFLELHLTECINGTATANSKRDLSV